jgi:hypothetical protein
MIIAKKESARYFSIYFFQIFARRAKIWKNKSLYYLAAAGKSGQ